MTHRMPIARLALALGGIFAAATGLSRAQSLNPLPKYLLTEKNVVILTAPQVVAGPTVLDAKWSPDGVHIAAMRRTERFALDNMIQTMHLVLWSAGKQSQEIWQTDMTPSAMPRVAWLSPETCTVEIKWKERVQGTDANGNVDWHETPHQSILWVDSAHDKVKNIAEMPDDHLYVSPNRPFAALLSPSQHQMILLNLDGTIRKRITLPEKTSWKFFWPDDKWTADGLQVQIDAEVPRDDKPGQTLRSYLFNVQTGELKIDQLPPPSPAKPVQAGLHLTHSSHDLSYARRTQHLSPLWLENTENGKQSAALLAPNASFGKISPVGSSALYLSEQTAFVTSWRIGPKEPFVTNVKMAVLSNAKQLGLGLVMYAQDYDEAFPAPSATLQSDLHPYLLNNDLYDGFNYTFGGGDLAKIANPATTELGTVDGPDGQAVIFADGHVRWIPR